MFPAAYFAARYFTPDYFPEVGADVIYEPGILEMVGTTGQPVSLHATFGAPVALYGRTGQPVDIAGSVR